MPKWIKATLCISLSLMCLFACVGYAAVSGSLTLEGTADATPPYALFISSVTDGSGIAGGSAAVNNFVDTIVNVSVGLGSDASSSKTLHVTVFNSTLDYYAFKGVLYNEGEYTYDNTNVGFDISGLSVGDKLGPGEYAYIDITFHYETYRGYSEDLSAVLDFHFGLAGEEEGTDYESYIMYFLTNGNGYGLNDSHKGHVVLESLAQYKVVYANDNLSGGNLKHLLSAVNTDQTSSLYFVYQYINETTILLYTYEAQHNTSTQVNQPVTVYKTTFSREAIGSSYSEWTPSASLSGTAVVKNIRTSMGDTIYAIDIDTWSRNT